MLRSRFILLSGRAYGACLPDLFATRDSVVIIELKTVSQLLPVHKDQLITYLKLTRKPLRLLINFNSALIKHGIVRIAD